MDKKLMRQVMAALTATLEIPAGEAQWIEIANKITAAHRKAKAALKALEKSEQ